MRNYTIPQDLMARFHGTIVQFDGQPVYVSVAGNKWHLYKPSTVHKAAPIILHKNMDPYDERMDISSLPMGYVNIPKFKTVRYVTRRPMKKFQQGINSDVLSVLPLPDTTDNEYFSNQDILYMQEFEDCVTGIYPDLL